MTGKEFLNSIDSSGWNEIFTKLYGEENICSQKRRYALLVSDMLKNEQGSFPVSEFPEVQQQLRFFSSPGRTELGGNHTDHNHGKVLAASIQLDSVAVAAPRNDYKVFFRSTGYPDVIINLENLNPDKDETGSTGALVRGIAAEFTARGTPVKGLTANADSTVLPGSGLSSSAAVEVLFCKIFDSLYADGRRSALELAQIGQKAENIYFGKPCGLMDQTACASGGVAAIDFNNLLNPKVSSVNFALKNYTLCVVNTKGSHANLTPDYAAIPAEMKSVASFFGKSVLREVDEKELIKNISVIRKSAGDRALTRAFHFFNENRRVDMMLTALEQLEKTSDEQAEAAVFKTFLNLVNESGNSSWELLQNIYSTQNPHEQGVALALAITKDFFEKNCNGYGACRVHGGGFAGTIQVYIPTEVLEQYRRLMEDVFGEGTLTVLHIRPVGAVELVY